MSLKTTEQSKLSFDDLLNDMKYDYEEEIEYHTISGKDYQDVTEYTPFKAHDLKIGEIIIGYPEITIFNNDDKKYDSLRLRLIMDSDMEYLDCYAPIPKRDSNGYIKNIRKSFDFYRTCFDFLYSILKYRDERNVVNENGEEKNHFEQVNIETFAKYVDQHERVGVHITEGDPESEYNSWEIYKLE